MENDAPGALSLALPPPASLSQRPPSSPFSKALFPSSSATLPTQISLSSLLVCSSPSPCLSWAAQPPCKLTIQAIPGGPMPPQMPALNQWNVSERCQILKPGHRNQRVVGPQCPSRHYQHRPVLECGKTRMECTMLPTGPRYKSISISSERRGGWWWPHPRSSSC